jgi:hypothetical protein
MKVLGKRVALTIIKSAKKIGSLFMPFQYSRCEAVVEHIGDEVTCVKPGDRVIYNVYKGLKWKDLLFTHEDNLEAIIEP